MDYVENPQNDFRVPKEKTQEEKGWKWNLRFTPEMIKEIEKRHKENPFWMWEKE